MTKFLIALSSSITFSFVTWQAFAQVNCEYDIQNAACMGYQRPGTSGSGGAPSSKPDIIHVYLKNRYGAIAVNPDTLAIGIANEYKCKESAEKAALAQCGSGCKVGFYRNLCATLVDGTNGQGGHKLYQKTATTQNNSDRLALADCKSDGATQCKVFTHGCSLPVQK